MITLIVLSLLIGAAVSVPLLRWGRLHGKTFDAIEERFARVFFLLVIAVVGLPFVLYPWLYASLLVGIAMFPAIKVILRSGESSWTGPAMLPREQTKTPPRRLSIVVRLREFRARPKWHPAFNVIASVLVAGILVTEGIFINAAAWGVANSSPNWCVWIGGKRAVPALRAALKDEVPWVRGQAIELLLELGEPFETVLVPALSDPSNDVRRMVANRLVKIGEPAVPALIVSLTQGEYGGRKAAVDVLVRIGQPAVPALVAALKGSDAYLRRWAADVLIEFDAKAAVATPALIAALKDNDDDLRRWAAEVLVNFGLRAVPDLIATMKNDDGVGAIAAAYVLARIGHAAVTDLLNEFDNPRREVRWAATWAIKQLQKSPVAVEPRTWSRDGRVREQIAAPLLRIGQIEALVKIGEPAIPNLVAALKDDEVAWMANWALIKIGQPAVPALLGALEDSNSEVRRLAAQSLTVIGDKRAVPKLINALEDNDYEVRLSAITGLGDIGDSRAVPALMATLKRRGSYLDEDHIRMRAVIALGAIGDRRAISALTVALKNYSFRVRSSAVEALAGIGRRAVPALIVALKDDDEEVRNQAAEALAKIGDKRAVPALIAALKDEDEQVRNQAAEALAKIGDKRAVPALKAAYRKYYRHYGERFSAALVQLRAY
jgi:HEAT repeat protein